MDSEGKVNVARKNEKNSNCEFFINFSCIVKKKINKKIILDKNKTFAIKKLQLHEASYTQNRQIVTE